MSGLAPEEYGLLRRSFANYTGDSCELSLANLAMYAAPQETEFLPLSSGVLIHFAAEHLLLVSGITPEPEPELLAQWAREYHAEIYDLAPGYAEHHPETERFFLHSIPEGEADYLYDCRSLVENSGPKLRKKRNLIRQFETLYPDFAVKTVTAENAADVVRFAEELNTRMVQAAFLQEENAAMEYAAAHWEELDLHGVLLEAQGKPAGFSVFSRIGTGQVFDVHFEKADHDFKGAPQKLTQCAAAAILACGGTVMNREQDMDVPGLRRAKESLAPCRMYRREHLILKALYDSQ